MEHIIVNSVGKVKRLTVNGRDYLVAPMTMIVPGVMAGSEGPVYYPPEEVASDPSSWDGIPIVVYHPKTDKGYVSARQPGVMATSEVGRIYNSRVSPTGSLQADGWFDIEALKRVDRRVLTALVESKSLDISTGLRASKDLAPAGSVYVNSKNEQKPYTHIARNYKPDHLAVLPDIKGACSIADGCGLLVNECKCTLTTAEIKGDSDMDRNGLINWLVTNCECWREEQDKDILNTLTDAKLKLLKDKAETDQQNTLVANAAVEKFTSLNGGTKPGSHEEVNAFIKQLAPVTANSTPTKADPNPTQTHTKVDATVVNSNLPANPRLTPEELEDLAFAREEKNRQKSHLVERIVTANCANEQAKAQARLIYNAMGLDNLRILASALPAPTTPNVSTIPGGDYRGQGYIPEYSRPVAPPVVNQDDSLIPPRMDWSAK
jgi:hypothetical protein